MEIFQIIMCIFLRNWIFIVEIIKNKISSVLHFLPNIFIFEHSIIKFIALNRISRKFYKNIKNLKVSQLIIIYLAVVKNLILAFFRSFYKFEKTIVNIL